jgi:hypothetical protein
MTPIAKSFISSKVMTQWNVDSRKKFEDQQWGHISQPFMLSILNTLYRKHTSTTKEKLGAKDVSFSSHENLYLSKFSSHPSSMVLKLLTNHPCAM